jgi:ATP-binding cassette subfamily B protein
MNVLRNNIYAFKTVWQISVKRVINIILNSAGGYAEWLFFSIYFMKYIIGAIEDQAPFNTIFMFILLCLLIFGVLALYNSWYESALIPLTDNKIYRSLYRKIYAKARNVELRCFEDAAFYDKYTMALDGAAEKMTASVSNFISAVIGVPAAAAAFYSMFLLDRYAILFVLSPVIGNFLLGGILTRLIKARYEEMVKSQRAMEYVNRVMHLAEFAKEIRFSNIHSILMKRFGASVDNICAVNDRYATKIALITAVKNILTFALVFEGIMIYAAYRAIVTKSIGLAELAVMFSAMVTSSWILIGLFENITEVIKNGQFLEYFRSFMEYKEKIPEDAEGIMPGERVDSIEFRNVSFAYKEGEYVIKDISFVLRGKQTAAFVGHNGAGKTTVVKLLFRLYDPTSGEILVNGINIKEYNLQAYRKLFAAAFQDYKIMSMSVKDNILMGAEVENGDILVDNALKRAGISEKVKALPYGTATTLTKEFDPEGAVLSGGEAQKIIVARAFAGHAPVKVFDEPSSALDPIAEYELYKSLIRESRGHTTLFISHRLSSVREADMVFMLEHGTIIERGTHTELMAAKSAYSEMYTKQAQNYLAVEYDRAVSV